MGSFVLLAWVLLLACSSAWAAPLKEDDAVAYDELSSYLEADILPDKVNTKMAVIDNEKLWRGGTLPYKIDFNPDQYVNAYNLLLSAITKMNAVGCVNLLKAGTGAEDFLSIRIDANFSSYLGRQGGEQHMTITEKGNTGSIMHEFMHTLGFGHEHNRPDRDDYVTVHFDNIYDLAKPYFQKYMPGGDFVGDVSPYDYTSLMHATSQHKQGVNIDMDEPVIERNDGGIALGQRSQLTDGDKLRMRIVYSCLCQESGNESMLFRYPGDCNMYYQCAHGQAIPMNCPQNLHFNAQTSQCDYIYAANCTFPGLV